MLNYKAVIFDLDDTLYLELDYVKSGYRAVSNYLTKHLNKKSDEIYDVLLKLFIESKTNVFNRYLKEIGLEDTQIIIECISVYRNHLPNITLDENVEILLEWLQSQGYLLGIITDGRPEGQWNKIESLGIKKYMNCIVVTDELGGIEFRKPSIIPYNIMVKELEISATDAIYVGDNPSKDFISANILGMSTIMLKRNHTIHTQEFIEDKYKPKFIIEDIFEIKNLLLSGEING